MRALRSSPTLAAPHGVTPDVDHIRRHTTGEAARPSNGSWRQTSLRHSRAADQSAAEHNFASSSTTPGLRSAASDAQLQSSAPGTSPSSWEQQPTVAHHALDGKPKAEADLLSFAAEEASWQHSCEGVEGQQVQANGLTNSDDSCKNGYAEASSSAAQAEASAQLHDSLGSSGNDSLGFDQPFVSCSPLPGEASADDPFQHSAAFSADMSQSLRQLSGLSMLADSQGSDLDSWGSFRLPDDSLNTMVGDMAARQAGSVQSSHPMVAANQQSVESSGPSPSLVPVVDAQNVKSADCEVSPNVCISSKQRLQLDLFLQSSGGSRSTAG